MFRVFIDTCLVTLDLTLDTLTHNQCVYTDKKTNIKLYNHLLFLFLQMFRLLVATCLVAFTLALDARLNSEWEAYKTAHKKQYAANTELLR